MLHNALQRLKAVGAQHVTIVIGYHTDLIQYAFGRRLGELIIE